MLDFSVFFSGILGAIQTALTNGLLDFIGQLLGSIFQQG